MRHIIGFCGPAGAGKDLAASMVPGGHRIAFADPLYEALSKMLGIPEVMLRTRWFKEAKLQDFGRSPRELLQTLGTEWGRKFVAPDVWLRVAFLRWQKAFSDGHSVIVVPDVRFSNEARWIHDMGGQVWLIHRPEVEPVAAHESEAGIPLGWIDRLIVNDGSVDQLQDRVMATFIRTATAAAGPPGS
jgi:hypothetical protein